MEVWVSGIMTEIFDLFCKLKYLTPKTEAFINNITY